MFQKIAQELESERHTMKVIKEIRCYLSALPSFCPARIVQIVKTISAKWVSRAFLRPHDVLWERELLNDKSFVPTMGDKVAAAIIQREAHYQVRAQQLGPGFLFDAPQLSCTET